MHIRAAGFRIDDPDIEDPEGKVITDLFFELTGAIVGRKDLDHQDRRLADDSLGWFGARNDGNIRNPEPGFLHLDMDFDAGPQSFLIVRSQVMKN